ncbi:monovalent cation/H(+) antiporter subunit G [Nannocystaceae bacterium ST9]
MGILQAIGAILLIVGWVFALTGSLGVLRMPDFYSRLHPAGMTDSFAQGLILLGLCMYALQELIPVEGEPPVDALGAVGVLDLTIKLALLIALIYLTSPTSTHAIAKAARLDRFTTIAVAGDESRVADIVVAGDHHAPLHEDPDTRLDVSERESSDERPADQGEA